MRDVLPSRDVVGRLAKRPHQSGDPLPAVDSLCLVSGANCDVDCDQHRSYSWRKVIGYANDKQFVCLQTNDYWPTVERVANCWFAEIPTPIPELPAAPKEWRCFHCDEVFTDWIEARNHFGYTPEDGAPSCKTTRGEDSELYHLKRRLELYQREDTDLHRALAAKEAEMQTAVRRAEETGYARGLEDAKKHPETLGLQRCAREPAAQEQNRAAQPPVAAWPQGMKHALGPIEFGDAVPPGTVWPEGMKTFRTHPDGEIGFAPTSTWRPPAPTRLTDPLCDDIIAALETYEWTGFARDDIRLIAETIETYRGAQPPVSEDTADAAHWRALIGCGRVRVLGSAGIRKPGTTGYAHIGVEFWTHHPTPTDPAAIEDLKTFVERVIAAKVATHV